MLFSSGRCLGVNRLTTDLKNFCDKTSLIRRPLRLPFKNVSRIIYSPEIRSTTFGSFIEFTLAAFTFFLVSLKKFRFAVFVENTLSLAASVVLHVDTFWHNAIDVNGDRVCRVAYTFSGWGAMEVNRALATVKYDEVRQPFFFDWNYTWKGIAFDIVGSVELI